MLNDHNADVSQFHSKEDLLDYILEHINDGCKNNHNQYSEEIEDFDDGDREW